MKLTNRQKEAIENLENNLLLIAGPGTGKTTVISKKVAYLLDHGYEADEILISTFTNKATEELKNRIAFYSNKSPHHLNISTIHQFCRQVINEFAYLLDPLYTFRFLDEISQKYIILKYIKELGIQEKHFASEDVLYKEIFYLFGFYDSINEHLVELQELHKHLQQYSPYERSLNRGQERGIYLKDQELLEIFFNYKKLMWEKKFLDLSQTLKLTYTLLKKFPVVKETLGKRYRYILVDEYQDTSVLQHEIFKLLKSENSKICVVGDDDQGIYSFRGATIKNMLFFQKDFDDVKIIPITDNFRSSQSIVNLSSELLHNIKERIDKPLQSKREKGQKVIYVSGENPLDSARKICSLILELKNQVHLEYSDIALLFGSVRWKFIGQGYHKVFNDFGIPCIIHRSGNYFDFPEVRQIMLILNILIYKDEISFELLENLISYLGYNEDIFLVLLERYTSFVPIKNISNVLDETEGVPDHLKWQLDELSQLKEKVVQDNYESLLEIIYSIFNILAYPERLLLSNNEKALLQLAYFTRLTESFEEYHSKDIKRFYETLLIFREKRTLEEVPVAADDEGVHISTIHNVKGLEYKAVFVCDFDPYYIQQSTFKIPDSILKQTDKQVEHKYDNQFRLLYTGLTRSRDYLFITQSKNTNKGKPLREPAYLSSLIDKELLEPYHGQGLVSEGSCPKTSNERTKESITLSYSAYATYLNCPMKYNLENKYQFKTPKNIASSFGDSIHKILELIHRSVLHNIELNEDDIYQALIHLIENHPFLDKETQLSKGKEWISHYLNKELFQFKDSIQGVEEAFEVFIGHHRIIGNIDLIVRANIGEYEIIDFKTGVIKEDHKDQLIFYALALELEKEIEVNKGTLYYLSTGERVDFEFGDEDKKMMKEKIESILEEILKKEFYAKPGINYCSFCSFYKKCGYSI